MLVFGRNVAKEILNSNLKVKKVYLQKDFRDQEILNLLNLKNIIYLDKSDMNKKVLGNHQGIILDVLDYKYFNLSDILNEDTIVMLDHIEDPHNFGAIIRTCEAAGIRAIIIPKNRGVTVNSTVFKVSVGTCERVKIVMVTNLVNTLKELKNNGFWVIGTDMNGTDYRNLDYSSKTILVIGNEGKGIGNLVRKNCDFVASIPMYGKVNSLNASVAAGIMIYEVIRRK